jgi:hypothetical protein
MKVGDLELKEKVNVINRKTVLVVVTSFSALVVVGKSAQEW